MKKPLAVKQIEGAEVPSVVLAESIVGISKSMKFLMQTSPLSERALLVLIQDACGGRTQISHQTIKQVLNGIGDLERLYVKSKKK